MNAKNKIVKPIRKNQFPHRAWTRAGVLLLGLTVLGGIPENVTAQTQNDDSAKTFLQRLRPSSKKQTTAKPAQGAPSAFSEPGTASDGWTQIGTSYATPNSGLKPDPTSSPALINPSPTSYNPSSRSQVQPTSPIYTIPATPTNTAQGATSTGTPLPGSTPGTGTIISDSVISTSASPNGNLPAPFPVNKREFHLPFGNFLSVIPQDQLKEVRLYVSRDNGMTWKQYQTMTKEKIQTLQNKNFPVATASDGEFWFAVRVVNQQGVETPGTTAPPTWRVIVNTTGKPLNSLLNGSPEQMANAGNPPTVDPLNPNLQNGRPKWSPTPDGSLAAGASSLANTSGSNSNPTPQNPNLVIFSVKDRGQSSIPDVSLPVYKIPNSKPLDVFKNPAQLAEEAQKDQKHVTAKPSADENDLGGLDSISIDDSPSDSSEDDMILTLGDSTAEEGLNSKIRYVNDPNLSIDYDVSLVGPSGVGRVELWGSLDDGQTWTYMAEDKDCRSPMNVALKSDGKYGFQILVFNGAGVGMERPQSGSMPQMDVVLDRINPRVQLYGIQLQAEFGDLEITWGAEDLNLGSNPVLLSWSSSTEGPWRAMTKFPLENTGRYTWRIPEGVPGK
ncbi:MAG: hypothetical protein K6C40_10635, partial [Thermoguttaceae bacterium]|nr:hypothetical protein [Thermoguttaceae bacterium]